MNSFATHWASYETELLRVTALINTLKRHPQATAVQAEIGELEKRLQNAEKVVVSTNEGCRKALLVLSPLDDMCTEATNLANALGLAAAKLPVFTKMFTDGGASGPEATKMAAYAQKLLVEENCSDEEAVRMAIDASQYVAEGLDERDAMISSRAKLSLEKDGVDSVKAKALRKGLRAGGSAKAVDVKALAKNMARLSTAAIENFNKNGILTECFRGGVTEVRPEESGVVPRGWGGLNKTWDNLPGMYNHDNKKVLIGTMDDGSGGRKIPGPNESAGTFNGEAISHGTPDLVGHEAGHAFDRSDGDLKSANTLFLAARARDILTGNLAKANVPATPLTNPPVANQPPDTTDGIFVTRDNYFVVEAEAGVTGSVARTTTVAGAGSQGDLPSAASETFAESFAMHFAGNSKWPALEAFWQNNPWNI